MDNWEIGMTKEDVQFIVMLCWPWWSASLPSSLVL
jgi:hypothetical protein